MTPISGILQPEQVILNLEATGKPEAVQEVLARLSGHGQVRDFDALRDAVVKRDAPTIVENGWGICIAHGRTETVGTLVMAAGRSPAGFPSGEGEAPIGLVFVAGIPAAMSSEYLRVVGAIARICRDRHQIERLLAAKTARDFVDLLAAGERKL